MAEPRRYAGGLVRLALGLVGIWLLSGCFGDPPLPDCGAGGPDGPQFSLTAQAPSPCPPPPPPPDCDGCITGDPHLRTFDGRRYSFQGAGEFLAVDDGAGFEVQVRTEPRGTNVSSVTAAAMTVGDQRITLTIDDGTVDVRVDGRRETLVDDEGLTLIAGGGIGQLDRSVIVEWPDGTRAMLKPFGRFGSLIIELGPDRSGPFRGLLGDGDGDPADDPATAAGEPLGSDLDFDTLYGDFASGWRVTDDTTLFDYAGDESTATYQILDYPSRPASLDDLTPEQLAFAEEACAAAGVTDPAILDDCLLDVGLTGDPAYADAAADLQSRLSRDDRTVRVTGNERVAWTNVTDHELADVPLRFDTAGHVLVQGRGLGDAVPTLTAIDRDTGETAWRFEGLAPTCAATPTADGRVLVMVESGSERALPNSNGATLLALDAETGEPLPGQAVTTPDDEPERLRICTAPPVIVDDHLLLFSRGTLWGFAIDDGLDVAWVADHGNRQRNPGIGVADDAGLVYLGTENDDQLVVQALDPATGEVLGETDIPGDSYPGNTPLLVTDEWVIVSVEASDPDRAINGYLLGLQRDGDELDPAWQVETGRDSAGGLERRPTTMTLGDDHVVGWTAGRQVAAFDLDDGGIRWIHRPTSFRNADPAPGVDDDGTVYVSTFGGAWLETISPAGEPSETLRNDDLFTRSSAVREVQHFAPLADGRLIAVTTTDDGPNAVVIAVEVER